MSPKHLAPTGGYRLGCDAHTLRAASCAPSTHNNIRASVCGTRITQAQTKELEVLHHKTARLITGYMTNATDLTGKRS